MVRLVAVLWWAAPLGWVVALEAGGLRRRVLVSGLDEAAARRVGEAVALQGGCAREVVRVGGSSPRRAAYIETMDESEEEWLVEATAAALYESCGEDFAVVLGAGPAVDDDGGEEASLARRRALIEATVERHRLEWELRVPMAEGPTVWAASEARLAVNARLDGAAVEGIAGWDVSAVCAYDGVVDEALRWDLLRLLHTDGWDPSKGPDPALWATGALIDVVDTSGGEGEEEVDPRKKASVGLRPEVMDRLCDEEPGAVLELQARLARLFRSLNCDAVDVTRLPAAALGDAVLPMACNAPTAADSGAFAWHIDCDPNLLPPSPWTDLYGTYPNRRPGEPRFVSALVYLAPDWAWPAWGAPTTFRDPPTGETLHVPPTPGRLVLLDQDVQHTVVAPNAAAGPRPRYSLVLKLVIHPHRPDQAIHLAPTGDDAPPTLIGSAAHGSPAVPLSCQKTSDRSTTLSK